MTNRSTEGLILDSSAAAAHNCETVIDASNGCFARKG